VFLGEFPELKPTTQSRLVADDCLDLQCCFHVRQAKLRCDDIARLKLSRQRYAQAAQPKVAAPPGYALQDAGPQDGDIDRNGQGVTRSAAPAWTRVQRRLRGSCTHALPAAGM
jgi:hypothetical protein